MKILSALNKCKSRIGVLGLGYVGLPLAVEFSRAGFDVVGFDPSASRIADLMRCLDINGEVSDEVLLSCEINFSCDSADLKSCDIFIVTVPTPVDNADVPDLTNLKVACELVGKVLAKGGIVIFESTVYPGCTEEFCVPLLEAASGLKFNLDFYCGYSPERINPGDKDRSVRDIIKVTSGSTPEIAKRIDLLYQQIITAGTHCAPSIKVAEASKAIENAQRDINIAFVNELSLIFHQMGIDTADVLDAAATKWNFLKFEPGLVGGHCIGVDPYYLAHCAKQAGYFPNVILAGRKLNDEFPIRVAANIWKYAVAELGSLAAPRVLIMGYSFKENCGDTRNTKVEVIASELRNFGCMVEIFDPEVRSAITSSKFIKEPEIGKYKIIIIAVAHDRFKEIGVSRIRAYGSEEHVLVDLKGVFRGLHAGMRL